MKIIAATLAASIALIGNAIAAPPTAAMLADPNLPALHTANGRLVYDFLDLWWNQHQPGEAFDRYVSKTDYLNHSVESASINKPQNYEEEKASESRVLPAGAKFQFKQMVAEGDLVITHILATNDHNPVGSELIEIERVRDGKVIDHWDLFAHLKPDSMVFSDLNR